MRGVLTVALKYKPYRPELGLTEKQVTGQVEDAARIFGVEIKRRNVAMFRNAAGRPVKCGEAGDSDWYSLAVERGPNRGRALAVEIKRESFDPRKVRGKDAKRWALQLGKLRELNRRGGLGIWLNNAQAAMDFFRAVAQERGLAIDFDSDGFPLYSWE